MAGAELSDMGGDSDTSFKVAVGIFGAVVIGLLALGAAKIALGDGLDGAFDGFGYGDDFDECVEAWPGLSVYEDHGESTSSSTDMHSEVDADGMWRSWSLNVQLFRDAETAARILAQDRAAIEHPDFEKCMTIDGYTQLVQPAIRAPDVVAWATITEYDGEDERSETVSWVEGELAATLEVYAPPGEAEKIVREQFEKARASVREQATR